MQSKSIGSVLQEMVGCGTSSSPDEQRSAAFEELALPLFDSLYNFAGWLVHNSNDAEDLVQETYLKALRSFASFQLGTNFRAWMFRILKNTFLSSISKRERRMTDARDFDEDRPERAVDTRTPETILVNRANTQLVQHAIDDLPAHYREPLFFVMWKRCPIKKSPRFCRSLWERLCHAWPEPAGRFANHFFAVAVPHRQDHDATQRCLPEPTATSDSRGSITTSLVPRPAKPKSGLFVSQGRLGSEFCDINRIASCLPSGSIALRQ